MCVRRTKIFLIRARAWKAPRWAIVQVKAGDRVRIRPKKRADVMDMALDGKIAVIEAVEQDVEGGVQLALVLDDDPGRDLGMMRQPGHRFFYATDEVEAVKEDA